MTFVKHLRSVSTAALQRLGILRKSWGCISWSVDPLLWDDFMVLSYEFWGTVLRCGARLSIHIIGYYLCSQWSQFPGWQCNWVYPYPSSIRCRFVYATEYLIRINSIASTLCSLPVPFAPVQVWSLIDFLIHLLAAQPQSTARLLYLIQYHYGTISVMACSMVWNRPMLKARLMLLWISSSLPFCISLFSLSLLSFSELALWAGVFVLIECIYSFSCCLAMPTSINNNKPWVSPYTKEG